MKRKDYTIMDSACELPGIAAEISEAIGKLDALCERLPENLLERVGDTLALVGQDDLGAIGPALAGLAYEMRAEIDALPPVQYEALERVVEQRMNAERARLQRAVRFEPPVMRGEDVLEERQKVERARLTIGLLDKLLDEKNVLPLSRLDALQGDDEPEAAA